MRIKPFSNLVLLLVFVVLTGCRTYGGYDTEQASYDRIETINALFAQDLEKAKGELQFIQQAAGNDAELQAAVAQYEALLAQHEAMVAAHDELASTLVVNTGFLGKLTTSYRDLNRGLGYIATDQLTMRNQYKAFATSLLDDSQKAMLQTVQARYQIAPPYYESIRYAIAEKSVSDALEMR